ncbi:Zinc-finger domain of monoamine-oxidase A repressor R1 protein [Quillaja saponaria]|uniref:Zinc-finger domain of monoamine-oxidase A repressor R1 protein n=1 Tax=Quillaja saponaria TaxID=32244 RepID=A0AAD7Q6E2_QUISA|nr:Zinc-finger domain of monoamine-oxidase A repressor R1 protein [Quillaja saponaria]
MMIDVDNDGQQAKRTNRSEIKVVGNRIYDSVNGKTCHQCRQKTMDFVASCKNQKLDKPCTIKFCHKCLMNRYGEKADTVDLVNDWKCPKCRGICNCSFCMKKRGYKPTGQLVRTAKASGFSSVSEFMDVRGPDNSGSDKILNDVAASPRKAFAPHEV